MKKRVLIAVMALSGFLLVTRGSLFAQPDSIPPGVPLLVADFTLQNVDGQPYSLSSLAGQSAVVVIFTGNHCVYAKKYEDRIIGLSKEFASRKVTVLLINSNDPELSEDDRFEVMQTRAKEKSYPCPYLHDPERKVATLFSATKNPETFVLLPNGEQGFKVVFHGKIDDNPLMPDKVERRYLNDVLSDILSGQAGPFPGQAIIGCGIKGVGE